MLFICGINLPTIPTYYSGRALLKKANGDVWKNVVIGGGLLGGLIGGVYWIFMGKNILGTHLGAVIGISVSVVMFGTILAGVLLGMAINRGTFVRIIVVLVVGAACFYVISPDFVYKSIMEPSYKSTMEHPNYSMEPSSYSKFLNPWYHYYLLGIVIAILLLYILLIICHEYFPSCLPLLILYTYIIILLFIVASIMTYSGSLLYTYLISSHCGVWLPIAGAYFGTVNGLMWAYLHANYLFCGIRI